MSFYVQKYPLFDSLPKITHHENLHPDAQELGRCKDTTESEKIFVLIKRGVYLSILKTFTLHRKTGDHYVCNSYDFPLKALSWFPKALEIGRAHV
jgi:hypothetical protein